MSPTATRRLLAIHRWSGLIVALAVLLFALTGLVLIYHHEIDELLGEAIESRSSGEAKVPLAAMLETARRDQPGKVPVYVFQQPEETPGVVTVGMGAHVRDQETVVPVSIDARTGEVLGRIDFEGSFTGVIYHLHAELLLGPGGRLLVGFLGLVFLLNLVTGAIVYGPMMKRFVYGLLRRDRHRRTFFADVHKAIGVSTLGWTLVVCVTGVLLSVGSLLIQYYATTELAGLDRPYLKDAPVSEVSTIDAAVASAEAGQPGRTWSFVTFPGAELASPRHFTVLLLGGEGLEKRMFTLALVDAKEPSNVVHRQLPWYLRALLISQPLHFGDYGGLPMRLLWTVFTIAVIVLAGSGVYVFFAGKRREEVTA